MAHMLGSTTMEREALPWPLTEKQLAERLKKERQRHHSPTAPIYVQQVRYSEILYKKVYFTPPMVPQTHGSYLPHGGYNPYGAVYGAPEAVVR